MHIKRAKQEIKDSIEAYLAKNEYGEYYIPALRQRPILLMGPPGIGKTQIMEQIARECNIGLVSYTITHHTRQSAIGLPFIQKKQYGNEEYSITEYTMSEIIASVYEKMEKTGLQEGILFIDEINCVSETLAPTMLQFLQCKTFGNQRVPEGWVIVAAGNPPEYNKSVRDFDVVTLDRIKRIDIEENFDVWKEYAYEANIHPAIISYLDLKKDHFYLMETTIDGKSFATARGWEDLSDFLKTYELLHKEVDREVIHQYIQNWKIAKDFANYLELYRKYKKDYGLQDIVEGHWSKGTIEKLYYAPFDERLSVVGMLIGKLNELFRSYADTDAYISLLYSYLKPIMTDGEIDRALANANETYLSLRRAEQLSRRMNHVHTKVIQALEKYSLTCKASATSTEEKLQIIRQLFAQASDDFDSCTALAGDALDHVFDFLEEAFGGGQEMIAFVTELNTNYYSIQYLKDNDCDKYHMYNKGLLFHQQREEILAQLDEL